MAVLEIQVEGIDADTLSVRRFCIEERLDELFCGGNRAFGLSFGAFAFCMAAGGAGKS
jgi:hypothetical protein